MSEYCLFLSTVEDNPISFAIRERTECSWSHVGFLRLADDWTFSAMSDGQGVAWRPANPKAKILKLSVGGIDAALSKALTQMGKAYDKLDILGIALGRDWSTANRFICSTLVMWAFDEIKIPLLNGRFIPRIHVTPRDILLSPFVTPVE